MVDRVFVDTLWIAVHVVVVAVVVAVEVVAVVALALVLDAGAGVGSYRRQGFQQRRRVECFLRLRFHCWRRCL